MLPSKASLLQTAQSDAGSQARQLTVIPNFRTIEPMILLARK